MAQRMTFGLFSGTHNQRVEFVHLRGPGGKGHAEVAVSKPKGEEWRLRLLSLASA